MRMIHGLLDMQIATAAWPRDLIGAPRALFGASAGGRSRPAPDGTGTEQPWFGFIPVAATRMINRDGGRSLFDGPTNGNWGGKAWSGGQYAPPGQPNGSSPPLDSGDDLYRQHDLCFDAAAGSRAAMRDCNRALIQGLDALPESPRDWPRPPPPGTEGDTQRFRSWAEHWFGW